MNKENERKLNEKISLIRSYAESLGSDVDCIIDDIENFEGYDELSTIKTALDRIIGTAKDARLLVLNAYDYLEDEEG